jgi:hypothetical protein
MPLSPRDCPRKQPLAVGQVRFQIGYREGDDRPLAVKVEVI